MIVDSSLLLSQFQKRRNVPVKYDRNLVAATIKAMERVEEIRRKRERVFTRRRLSGKLEREKRRKEDRRVVAQGEHLIAKEMKEVERARLEPMEQAEVSAVERKVLSKVLGQERMRTKVKRKMLVGGGVENEMEVD